MKMRLPIFVTTILIFFSTICLDEIENIMVPGDRIAHQELTTDLDLEYINYLKKNIPLTNYQVLQRSQDIQEDLAQRKAVKNIQNQLALYYSNKPQIFFGWLYGSSTILNWLSTLNYEQQERIARLLILRGTYATGHSDKYLEKDFLLGSPTFRTINSNIIGLVEMLFTPYYRPWGMQAKKSVRNISPNIPIIFIYDETRDFAVSVNDSRKLYCILANYGHPQTYLIEFSKESDRRELAYTLRHLLHYYEIPNVRVTDPEKFNLEKYKPDVDEIQELILNSDIGKRKCVFCMRN